MLKSLAILLAVCASCLVACASDEPVDLGPTSTTISAEQVERVTNFGTASDVFAEQLAVSEGEIERQVANEASDDVMDAAIRREAFLRVGGFDQGYATPNVEDTAFGQKLARLGVRVRVHPDLEVEHVKQYSLWTMLKTDFMRAVSLTTEEEGIAMLAGAWLGGARGALLMQSSGVGNCINMLSLVQECRFPLLTLITMRGQWGEFNPRQAPMGQGTPAALENAGVIAQPVERAEEIGETVAAAARLAFSSYRAVAVLIGQRVIGFKNWSK